MVERHDPAVLRGLSPGVPPVFDGLMQRPSDVSIQDTRRTCSGQIELRRVRKVRARRTFPFRAASV